MTVSSYRFVIAPSYKQFLQFIRREDRPDDFYYVARPDQLIGYRGELIIVNADQCPNLFADFYDDKNCSVRWVEL